jgi:hypothetical protein
MRKPRDFYSELKALDERARQLRTRKLHQLGELVIATGADELPIHVLAGALLAAYEAEGEAKEAWRKRGAAFFQQPQRRIGAATPPGAGGAQPGSGEKAQADGEAGA